MYRYILTVGKRVTTVHTNTKKHVTKNFDCGVASEDC